jgi:hypothetical protein
MKKIATLGLIALTLAAAGWGLYQVLQPDAAQQRLAELRQLQLPSAGVARFAFLKQEMPDIVGQVTCSCCGNKLIQCYNGACPVSCGPCNEQGKKTFDMFTHGKSIKDIQAHMAMHHPVTGSM